MLLGARGKKKKAERERKQKETREKIIKKSKKLQAPKQIILQS